MNNAMVSGCMQFLIRAKAAGILTLSNEMKNRNILGPRVCQSVFTGQVE